MEHFNPINWTMVNILIDGLMEEHIQHTRLEGRSFTVGFCIRHRQTNDWKTGCSSPKYLVEYHRVCWFSDNFHTDLQALFHGQEGFGIKFWLLLSHFWVYSQHHDHFLSTFFSVGSATFSFPSLCRDTTPHAGLSWKQVDITEFDITNFPGERALANLAAWRNVDLSETSWDLEKYGFHDLSLHRLPFFSGHTLAGSIPNLHWFYCQAVHHWRHWWFGIKHV